MILTNIKCPICEAIFSVCIDTDNKICISKSCPKCKNEIEIQVG